MSEKKMVGPARCPICACSDAELWSDVKGNPYIKCEGCVGMSKSMSREGKTKLRAFALPAPAADPKPKDKDRDPAPAPKRKGLGLGFV